MIEKNIFQTWWTADLEPELRDQVEKTKALNPGWTYRLYTDDEMDAFVAEHYPGEIAECYGRLNIPVAKADFWRYLVLYKYGGVYIDLDSAPMRPLDSLVQPQDEGIIAAESNPNVFVQWALMFRSGHPVLKRTIENIVDNIQTNRYPNSVYTTTGPIPYTQAIHSLCSGSGYSIDELKSANAPISLRGAHIRFCGIDYRAVFDHYSEYTLSQAMSRTRRHWTEYERTVPLLKGS